MDTTPIALAIPLPLPNTVYISGNKKL